MKKNFLLMAGLALTLPSLATLPGCNPGNSGGPLGEGSSNSNSIYSGLSCFGPVNDAAGNPIGNLNFTVANNGSINGTLNSALLTTRALSTRAVINGTGQIAADGHFTITFLAKQNNQNVTYTFEGQLIQVGSGFAAQNLLLTILNNATSTSTTGSFSLTVNGPSTPSPTATTPSPSPTPTTPGTGGTGSGSFSFGANNSNAAGTGFSATTTTGTRITAGSLNTLSLNFINASSPTNLRNLTITLNKNSAFAVDDTFSISSGQAQVLYGEGTPTNKAWAATGGQVKITALSANSVTVQLMLVRMEPSAIAGPGQTNQATGGFTIMGSGSSNISG